MLQKSEKKRDATPHKSRHFPRQCNHGTLFLHRRILSGCCSHIIGLLQGLQHWQLMGFTEVPGELSCTSLPQQWSIPRGTKIEPDAAPNIRIVKPKPERKRKPIENQLKDCRKIKVTNADIEHLQSLNLPISYLVNQPTKNVSTHLGEVNIGSGLSTQALFYEGDGDKRKSVSTDCGNLQFPLTPPIQMPVDSTLPDELKINEDKAREIEECTRDQSNCSRWYGERRQRITASKFFEVTKRRSFNDKYLTGLTNGKSVNSSATSYGKSNEMKARRAYIKTKGNHVHDCGLVVNPEFPFIGATPDGKVCHNGECGILEIKCPYSARDMDILEAVSLPNFCLDRSEGETKLKESHAFYCQVQGQLLVTGAPFCDFVVFTRKDLYVERVYPNINYMEGLLHKLCDIYFTHVHNFLQCQRQLKTA